MNQIKLYTTGTQSPITINDLGAISFDHPTSGYTLTDYFKVEELKYSVDLQYNINSGYCYLTNESGYTISNISTYQGSATVFGTLTPCNDGVYNLGSSNKQWNSLYVSGNTIYIGNVPIGVSNGGTLTVSGKTVVTQSNSAQTSDLSLYVLNTSFSTHTGNTNNPHNTTATQISAYTITQSNLNFLSANTLFYTQSQSNSNFLSANTSFYTQSQSNSNFLSANTSYYTQAQSNNNFLSANTSYYTQSQSNSNFLSANTSYYTQTQANSNFVSGLTFNSHTGNTNNPHNTTAAQISAYTITQSNTNFLSANTSYYTQSQTNSNFLSANTSYYTQNQTNSNFLSANTSYYTQTQANSNFLSANTSYYTQAQANANFLSANTATYTQAQINANFVSATTFNSHTGNTNNPHNTTVAQISAYTITQANNNFLSANTSFYTQTQANANFLSANTSYYTQAQANSNFVSAITYQSHTANTNNPHNTTAAQISAYTITQSDARFLTFTGGTITGNLNITGTLNITGKTDFHDGAVANNNFGVGVTSPTAYLHLRSGTTVASTSSLKINPGLLLATPEIGAFEYDGTVFYYTDNLATPVRQSTIPSAYGSIYEQNAAGTLITLTNAGTWYGWASSTDDVHLLTSRSAYTLAHQIKVSNGGDGTYFVSASLSVLYSRATQIWNTTIFYNNGIVSKLQKSARTSSTNNFMNYDICGIVTGVTSNSSFDIRFSTSRAGDTVTLYDVNFQIIRIGR